MIVRVLPGPYERWFVEATGEASPVESRATCDDCRMLPSSPDLPPQGPFDPEVKCCSFHPHLAPHFVGAILDHEVVRARLRDRVGVSPLGLGPPLGFRVTRFGQKPQCPFYDTGKCTIWSQRGIVCASFHCRLDRGVTGAALWNRFILLFNVLERALARWRIAEAGLDAAACDALLREPTDRELDTRAWGDWCGREEEYFRRAHEEVSRLSLAEVIALGGSELAGLTDALKLLMTRYRSLELPPRWRRNPDIVQLGRRFQNRGCSLDLLEVPEEIDLDAPDEKWLRKLLDWQVLIPTSE
jgi:hypothetical protein